MIKWVVPMPSVGEIHLCLTEKQYEKARKATKAGDHEFPESGGVTSRTQLPGKDNTYIVCLSKEAQEADPIEIAGVLVHEAVHIWQWYVEDTLRTQSSECGIEQEAYGIQSISQALMCEYARLAYGKKIV